VHAGGKTAGATGGALLGGALGWMVAIGASTGDPGSRTLHRSGSDHDPFGGSRLAAQQSGGLTRALIGMGIPEYEAKRYEGKIKDGNILPSVHTEESKESDRATKILEAGGAVDISYRRGFCSQGTAASRSLISSSCGWDLLDPTYKPLGREARSNPPLSCARVPKPKKLQIKMKTGRARPELTSSP
jgi:hypothetical protein